MSKIDLDSEKARRKRYLELYQEKEKIIQEKLNKFDSKSLPDELEKVDLEIEQIYNWHEIESIKGMEVYTKEQSDKFINNKIKDFNHRISLLTYKKHIIQSMIDSGHFTDKLTEINAKIEIEKIKDNIEAKEELIKAYVKRKDVTF